MANDLCVTPINLERAQNRRYHLALAASPIHPDVLDPREVLYLEVVRKMIADWWLSG